MGKFVDCPFCGQRGVKTKEHVWAQWLHETAGAQALLDGTHGERIAREHRVFRKDQQGRYRAEAETPGPYAKWLPNLTVDVCRDCNGGWMSRLESDAKAILAPFIFSGTTTRLSAEDLRTLTIWATKSWMAYALTVALQQNPFTEAEYRGMAESAQPLGRSQVWLLHSTEPRAQVAMGITSTLHSFEPPDLEKTPNNTAYAYLAVAGVVMALLLLSTEVIDALRSLPDGDEVLDGFMVPPMSKSPVVRRAWPGPRPQYFPLGVLPDADLAAFIEGAPRLFSETGLPVDGLTDEAVAAVREEFLSGADPVDLRRRWEAE
ncbi:hypothetical protein E1263_26115 [Kribbella antibiotica]|uniref:HNH endonuclease n=1 Tax=Kribbella antibiotica TaxID=190195 RepID=A0A4R4ZDT2_9ACTN|nr:hypothetical protein [Kribbella antibiotica]TDD55429.1 hypothetical protein E1263_26115 [Kribbella antibiotica]